MRNVKTKVDGNTLTITVDLAEEGVASGSGKSIVIASTQGNKPVPQTDGVIMGLNVYRKAV